MYGGFHSGGAIRQQITLTVRLALRPTDLLLVGPLPHVRVALASRAIMEASIHSRLPRRLVSCSRQCRHSSERRVAEANRRAVRLQRLQTRADVNAIEQEIALMPWFRAQLPAALTKPKPFQVPSPAPPPPSHSTVLSYPYFIAFFTTTGNNSLVSYLLGKHQSDTAVAHHMDRLVVGFVIHD